MNVTGLEDISQLQEIAKGKLENLIGLDYQIRFFDYSNNEILDVDHLYSLNETYTFTDKSMQSYITIRNDFDINPTTALTLANTVFPFGSVEQPYDWFENTISSTSTSIKEESDQEKGIIIPFVKPINDIKRKATLNSYGLKGLTIYFHFQV